MVLEEKKVSKESFDIKKVCLGLFKAITIENGELVSRLGIAPLFNYEIENQIGLKKVEHIESIKEIGFEGEERVYTTYEPEYEYIPNWGPNKDNVSYVYNNDGSQSNIDLFDGSVMTEGLYTFNINTVRNAYNHEQNSRVMHPDIIGTHVDYEQIHKLSNFFMNNLYYFANSTFDSNLEQNVNVAVKRK